MYSDIQVYKAGAYITKILDNYIKTFETCNELSRKLKVTEHYKKKNSPPVLFNLPLYIRSVGGSDDEYKSSIMMGNKHEFGPKEDMPIFD